MPRHRGDLPVYNLFDDKEIRRGFMRKVLSLVATQMMVGIAFALITTLVDSVREYLTEADNYAVVVGLLVASVVSYIVTAIMVCCLSINSRRNQLSYIHLSILTVSFALIVSIVCSAFRVEAVVIALGIIILCCVGGSVFSFNTKFDLDSWQGALFCLFWGSLCTSALIPVPYSSVMGKTIAGVLAIAFMLCWVVDIHCIMRGDNFSPDEYAYAASRLFPDIAKCFGFSIFIVIFLATGGEGGDEEGYGDGCNGCCRCCCSDGCYHGSCGSCGGGTRVERENNSDGCCLIYCSRRGQVTRRNPQEGVIDAVLVEQPLKIFEKEPAEQMKLHVESGKGDVKDSAD